MLHSPKAYQQCIKYGNTDHYLNVHLIATNCFIISRDNKHSYCLEMFQESAISLSNTVNIFKNINANEKRRSEEMQTLHWL